MGAGYSSYLHTGRLVIDQQGSGWLSSSYSQYSSYNYLYKLSYEAVPMVGLTWSHYYLSALALGTNGSVWTVEYMNTYIDGAGGGRADACAIFF